MTLHCKIQADAYPRVLKGVTNSVEREGNMMKKWATCLVLTLILSSVPGTPMTADPHEIVPGDLVRFGNYYRNAADVKEPVVWRVLSIDGTKILVISNEVLFYAAFDETPSDHTLRVFHYPFMAIPAVSGRQSHGIRPANPMASGQPFRSHPDSGH